MAILHDETSYQNLETTPRTLAFEHALDISIVVNETMEAKKMSQKDLAKKLGISAARVSQMLNTQPNMTLESIASLELALDIKFFDNITTRKNGEPVRCQYLGDAERCPSSSSWDIAHLESSIAKAFANQKRDCVQKMSLKKFKQTDGYLTLI